MKVDKRKLGKQIKMVRTSKMMTQEELAEMIDVSPTFISLVETGTKALSLSKAIELADVLKVSMATSFSSPSSRSLTTFSISSKRSTKFPEVHTLTQVRAVT